MNQNTKTVHEWNQVIMIGSAQHVSHFVDQSSGIPKENTMIHFSYDELLKDPKEREAMIDQPRTSVHVVNPDQYMSQEMKAAIDFAIDKGKEVTFLEPLIDEKMQVICISGSARFKKKIIELAERLICEGHIVLTPFIFEMAVNDAALMHAVPLSYLHGVLDRIHMWKIDHCDKLLVANFSRYFGEDTRKEILYAYGIGKPVQFLEPYISTPGDITYFSDYDRLSNADKEAMQKVKQALPEMMQGIKYDFNQEDDVKKYVDQATKLFGDKIMANYNIWLDNERGIHIDETAVDYVLNSKAIAMLPKIYDAIEPRGAYDLYSGSKKIGTVVYKGDLTGQTCGDKMLFGARTEVILDEKSHYINIELDLKDIPSGEDDASC